MKELLCLFFCLLATAFGGEHPLRTQQHVRYQPGQQYVYEYSSRVMSGIPSLLDQYSGLEITSDVVVEGLSDQLAVLKMTQIRLGKHNGLVSQEFPSGSSPVMDHQLHQQFQKELTKPIRFVFSEGKVTAFESDQSEPEWSLNMKKGLLALFNVNLVPKKIIRGLQTQKNVFQNLIRQRSDHYTVYPVYEEGIGGICETVYEIHNSVDPKNLLEQQEDLLVLNVTKTRNYDNCLTEPIIANDNYDVRGCPVVCRQQKSFPAVEGYYPTPDVLSDPYMSGCPCGKEPHESPVDSYSFTNYNISLIGSPLIEGIYSEGKVVYSNNGDEVLVITQQNLTLVQQGQQVTQRIQSIPRPQRHNDLSFRIPKPELPKGYKLPLDIPYYHLFGQPDVQELQNLIPELLESLAQDVASEQIGASAEDIGQKSVQLVNAMAVLEEHQLEQLFEQVAQEGNGERATQKQQVVRKLFLDALPLTGSNPAAQTVKKLIQSGKVTGFEAKEVVQAVPQNLFLPDVETMDSYLELFQSPKVQNRRHLSSTTGIAFGKMVKEGCVKRQATPGDIPDDQSLPHSKRNPQAKATIARSNPQARTVIVSNVGNISDVIDAHNGVLGRRRRSAQTAQTWEEQFQQDVCDQEDVNKYVQIIARLLQQANTFHKKVTLIETLAHMGVPEALPVLQPYISGSALHSGQCPGYVTESSDQKSEECDFVRQVAIYALAHIAENYPKQVAPLVLNVYNDPSEAYEVRIAAFTTFIFSAPDKTQLERIASELHRETNRQIRSFVSSSLSSVANISVPCFQQVSQHAQSASEHAPNDGYGYQYSSMVQKSFYDEDKDFGLYAVAEWTQNNISRVPRAGYLAVGQSTGPFSSELLQIGFNAKGMETLVNRALEPEGVVSAMFEGMRAKGRDRRLNKRNADSPQQALEALKNRLGLQTRGDDEPKATVFFKLFDRTSYYALDKHYLHQLIDGAEDSLKDIATNLMQGQQYHYVKLVMPSQLYKVVPSEVGLPVVITHRHPLLISLKVDQAKLQLEVSPKTVYPTGANITAQITPSVFYSSFTFAFVLNPSDRQAYGTHVQKITHAQLPVELSVGYSRPKNLLTWSVIPKTQDIFYQKTKSQTFIAKASISGAPDSDWLENAKEIQSMATPFQYDNQWATEAIGIGARVRMTSESPWSTQPITSGSSYEENGMVAALVQAWRNPGLKGREVHVTIAQDEEQPIQGFDFSLRYKWVEDSEQQKDSDDSDESSASDESDSDQSDESSSSQSSESNSSESNSAESSEESSESSNSSEQSNESKNQLKRKINRRMNKGIASNESNKSNKSRNKRSLKKESNESSDESSNESGDMSNSKSGSKESSQSSSSESNSSENKSKSGSNKSKSSKSAESSESESSSSSESDQSSSLEDKVFDYDDVMQLILGQDFKKRTIKKITKELVKNTADVWKNNWDEDSDDSSSDESNEEESDLIPQTISHDIKITAVARGPRPTYYAANVLFVHTYDNRITWLKTDGHIKAPKGVYMTVPTFFCADAVISFPTLPNEFYFEPQQMSQQARMQAQVGWGPQCQSRGGVIVTGVMEQTDDHVLPDQQFALQDGQSSAQVQPWYQIQCQIDREEGRPQSYACERAIEESSYFNQMVLDIKYKNVSKVVQNYTRKAELALKVHLYEYLDINAEDNAEDQIRIVTQFSQRVPEVPLANLEIKTPDETQQYKQIHVPYVRPVSALLSVARVYKNLWTGYESRDSCHVMENAIRTFDNVTFEVPESKCQLLIAKDCSAHERFAVFAQQLDEETKTKTVTIITSGQEIKLLPPQQQNVGQVVIDGKAHEITFRNPVTLIGDDNNLRVYLRATPSEATNPIIVVQSDGNQLEVTFDGKNVKVQLNGDLYKGKTCGLCGDNNGESDQEFTGPDFCEYSNSEDFSNSYALNGEHCEQIPVPKGPKRCPQRSDSSSSSEESGEQSRKQIIRAHGPNGVTTLVRQEVSQQLSSNQRSEQMAAQARAEEVLANQQRMAERQMSRQDGQPLSPAQEEALVGGNAQNQKAIQRLRTYYIERDDMVCFSVKPSLQCQPDVSKAVSFRDQKTDFHCLPKNSPFTQQLIQESQKQVIRQLINKRVDLRQVIQVPSACVAI